MVTQFDEKGKIFTSIVSKQPVKVTIQTLTNQVHGEIHVRRDGRLKDELDSGAKFVAVTNANIFDADGSTLLTRSRFVTINSDQIIWVFPDTELITDEPEK